MMNLLGISAYYHDSAACVVRDGEIVAAAQEERFTRRKHDARFPEHAIAACLASAGLAPRDIDHVVFYEKPFVKFERLLETYLAYAPARIPELLEGAADLAQGQALPEVRAQARARARAGRRASTGKRDCCSPSIT